MVDGSSHQDAAVTMGTLSKNGIYGPIAAYVSVDATE